MTKWNIKVSSNVIIEAETSDEAKRELEAEREYESFYGPMINARYYKRDLLLNAHVESIEVEPK